MQRTLLAAGRIIPFIYLYMQELSEKFGLLVHKTVDKLTTGYKKMFVIRTQNPENFSPNYIKNFLKTIILLYIQKNKILFIISS